MTATEESITKLSDAPSATSHDLAASDAKLSDAPSTTSHDLAAPDAKIVRPDSGVWTERRKPDPSVWTKMREITSSTEYTPLPKDIWIAVDRLFTVARGETFEDGMISEFSRDLTELLGQYGDSVIRAVGTRISNSAMISSIVAEALRWLGEVHHDSSRHERLRLLERELWNETARVRDAAALGLASMDDPAAIPYLERAIAQETNGELRADMQQVLEQLINTRAETTNHGLSA
jgi:hypothetical protein